MAMYAGLKHMHLLLIGVSVCLFLLRFSLVMLGRSLDSNKWLKIIPHVVDSLLIVTGIALVIVTGFMPFAPGMAWMTEKLICVAAYIGLAMVALRYSHGKLFKIFAFLGALGWLYAAADLALTKTPQLLG